MLVRDKTSDAPHVTAVGRGSGARQIREADASLVQRKLINPDRSELSNTWFSLPLPAQLVHERPEVREADLIHLHWVSGFLAPASARLLQQTGKPIVWSQHDQRAFTGGCHFSAGCDGFTRDCARCPQLRTDAWSIPQTALAESLRCIRPELLTVVCPSRWMAECARKSALFCSARVEVIPNSICTDEFRPSSGRRKRELGLPDNAIVLLAGADHSNEKRKGLNFLSGALRHATGLLKPTGVEMRLVVFGASQPPEGFDCPAVWAGRVESRHELAEMYSSADAFLLPSLEDNLPNTMLEALCCGTPVIGFQTGTVPEAVAHGRNGLIAEAVTAEALGDSIARFCLEPALRGAMPRQRISDEARSRFDPAAQARAFLRLYDELLAAAARPPIPEPGLKPGATASEEFTLAFDSLVRRAKRERWKNRWLKISRRLALSVRKEGSHE
jgi:glycosyltransferase involved in cell wall biosynthesis